MVVFGGHSIATTDYLWELTLDDPPTWAPIVATGTGPAERYGHSAVYDATHDQMIVFGGRTPSLSNETWALQFATNPPTWQKLSPTGSLPGGRLEHVAILDQPRNRMVIYGGTGNQRYADVWTLSLGATPAWTLAIFASSIGSLTGAVAAFDGAADRMVVFSGYTSTSYPTELFALDLATMTWTTPATSPQPGSRWLAAFAFDPATRRGILHGGVVSTSPSLGDTWELTMSPSPAWTHLPPSPPAAPTLSSPPDGATGVPLPATLSWSASSGATSYRVQVSTSAAFLSTVYDQNDIVSTLVNVGGLAYSTGYYWRVSAANVGGSGPYSTVFGFTTAPPPPPPEAPTLSSPADGATGVAVPVALIWNASSGATSYRLQISTDASFATVVFDQSNIGGSSASVSGLAASTMYHWRVSATNISGTSPYSTAFGFTTGVPPPPPSVLGTRYAAAGVFDPVRGRYLMMGGASGTNPVVYRKDVAELVLGRDSSWVSTSVGGSMFSPRYGHSAIYDPLRDRVIVFGGYGGSYLGDLWQIQLSPIVTGSLLTAAGTPPTPRDFHSAIYDPVRDRMILFGGNDGAPHGDVWELTLSGTPTWTRIDVAGSGPSARLSHRAIYDPLGDRMIVFGGYDSRSLNDLWALTLSGTPAIGFAAGCSAQSLVDLRPQPESGDPLRRPRAGDRIRLFGHLGADAGGRNSGMEVVHRRDLQSRNPIRAARPRRSRQRSHADLRRLSADPDGRGPWRRLAPPVVRRRHGHDDRAAVGGRTPRRRDAALERARRRGHSGEDRAPAIRRSMGDGGPCGARWITAGEL
jgi:hypothetical protein